LGRGENEKEDGDDLDHSRAKIAAGQKDGITVSLEVIAGAIHTEPIVLRPAIDGSRPA
jgi:hypothetical protein